MDGRKTRGRIYRQRIIEVLANYIELTPNQRLSVVDSLSNHIIRRGRHRKLRIMSSFISAAKNVNL